MCATFNGNICAKIIPCNSLVGASDETVIITFYNELSYKNLLLRKKIKPTTCGLDLARVEKGEVILDSAAPKSYFLFLSRTTIWPSVWIRRPTWRHENLSHQKSFVTRFLNGASEEIKVKLNESRLLKFYHVKQLKENSTENSPEKNFKEDSQLNELKFKELCFPDTLSKISSHKLH